MSYAIKVIWANGEEEYAKQGTEIARFANRAEAKEMADFMKMGMDDGELQSVNVIPFPAPGGPETLCPNCDPGDVDFGISKAGCDHSREINEEVDILETGLREFLTESAGEEPAALPLLLNEDGTINREKTLALPCYEGFEIRRLRKPASPEG